METLESCRLSDAFDNVHDFEKETATTTTIPFLSTTPSPPPSLPRFTTSLSAERRGVGDLSTLVVVFLLVITSSVGITYWGLENTRPKQYNVGSTVKSTSSFVNDHNDPSRLYNNQNQSHHHKRYHKDTNNSKETEIESVWFECPIIDLTELSKQPQPEQQQKVEDEDYGGSQTRQNPHSEEHQEADLEILRNMTDYLQNFRHLPFDFWPLAYDDYKAAMVQWKQLLLQDFLMFSTSDGDVVTDYDDDDDDDAIRIYESASGLGLNLLMTAEILQEERQKRETATTRTDHRHHHNVKLYGNDYVPESVRLARIILQDDVIMKGDLSGADTTTRQYGQVCQGDSTKLHQWVPAASFDLVYTGFITPLQDPLNMGLCQEELQDIYADLCESRDPQDQQRAHLLQQRQEDWFALWVQEMLRLAKPGAVVGIEMISYPQCDDLEEWGGVSHEFWHTAMDRYGWDADPASLVIQHAHMPGRRYHVLMRKK